MILDANSTTLPPTCNSTSYAYQSTTSTPTSTNIFFLFLLFFKKDRTQHLRKPPARVFREGLFRSCIEEA